MHKILVVEDNDANFALVEEILSEFSVEILRAENGTQFYARMNARPMHFDLILMDLMLPDTDGIELTKYLINKNYEIPIIFISAYTEKCEEVYDLGIEYFISKPILTDLFLSILSKYITLESAAKQPDTI